MSWMGICSNHDFNLRQLPFSRLEKPSHQHHDGDRRHDDQQKKCDHERVMLGTMPFPETARACGGISTRCDGAGSSRPPQYAKRKTPLSCRFRRQATTIRPSRIAAHSRSGVAGMSTWRMRKARCSASTIAFITAGGPERQSVWRPARERDQFGDVPGPHRHHDEVRDRGEQRDRDEILDQVVG
jgi:hypothetical protein